MIGKNVFDQQIEQARGRRRQQLRKVLLATVIITILCAALALIYIVVQRRLSIEYNPVVSPAEMPKAVTPVDNAVTQKLFQQQLIAFEQEQGVLLKNPNFLELAVIMVFHMQD